MRGFKGLNLINRFLSESESEQARALHSRCTATHRIALRCTECRMGNCLAPVPSGEDLQLQKREVAADDVHAHLVRDRRGSKSVWSDVYEELSVIGRVSAERNFSFALLLFSMPYNT